MKFNIEDYLHKIDTAFQKKTKKDIQMIYIMVVFGIFAFAYLLFYDSSFESFERTQKEVSKLQTKINSDELYLQTNPETVVTNINKEIQELDKSIAQVQENNLYIKSKIETISSIIYDEQSWGEYLDSITTNAQKYHMKVSNFTNKYAKKENSFGHVLDISVQATGGYTNTLKFINALEQSDLVVDIHGMNLEAKGKRKLYSDLNISVWGITY